MYGINLSSRFLQDREIEIILIKTYKVREIVLRKMALNIVPSYRRSTSTPLQLFFNAQKQPVQSSDGVRDENMNQMQAVSSVPDPKPAEHSHESPQAIATDQLNHSAGFSTRDVIKSTEETDSDGSLRTESAALLGNANVDGGGKQESCTKDASTKPKSAAEQENSQSNIAQQLFMFSNGEPPARLNAYREPERSLPEQLAGGQQNMRIEMNELGNAAPVAEQMSQPSGPFFAHICKQLGSVLALIAIVICCVVLLIAFVLFLGLGYFLGRQSVHPSNAVGVTCHCATVTLEVFHFIKFSVKSRLSDCAPLSLTHCHIRSLLLFVCMFCALATIVPVPRPIFFILLELCTRFK